MIATETVPCNQCGSSDASLVALERDREYWTDPQLYRIVKCWQCGLVYLNPRPVAADLGRIYPKAYHAYTIDKGMIAWFRKRAGVHRMRRVLRHIPGRGLTRLLDIGCGNGWQLDIFRSLCPGVHTVGIDIDEEACEVARQRGHEVFFGRFEDVHLDRQFDLINLTHVIEHLSDPQEAVGKATRMLNHGGLLIVETPNLGAWEYRYFQAGTWGAYHIPRHWTFYDRHSVQSLGELEGLKLVDWYCHPGPTHWIWTMHNLSLTRKGWWPWQMERLFDPVAIFRGGLRPTLLLAIFWCVDRLALLFGRQTSVMTAVFEKTP